MTSEDQRVRLLMAQPVLHQRTYVEADLEFPSNRQDPFGRRTAQQPTETSEAGPEEILQRFAQQLAYYQQKYPNDKPSSMAKIDKPLTVLLKSYDDQLAISEQALIKFESDMEGFARKVQALVAENEALASNSNGASTFVDMRKRIEVLMEENELLVAQQKKNEALAGKSFALERELAQAKHQANPHQSNEITTLHNQLQTLQSQLNAYEKSASDHVVTTRQLRTDLRQRESELVAERAGRRMVEDRLASVERLYGVVRARMEEYDACCLELGVDEWLTAFDKGEAMRADGEDGGTSVGVLLNALKRFKREHGATVAQLNDTAARHQDLVKAHRQLITSTQLSTDKSTSTLHFLRAQLESHTSALTSAQAERDAAVASARAYAREVGQVEERVRVVEREAVAMVERERQAMKERETVLRDQWVEERQRVELEMNELKKSKVDLQCEIGVLLRDRRSQESSLYDVLSNLDVQRDKFRKEVLKM